LKCGACAYCVRIGSRVPPYTNIFSRARIFYFFLFLNDIKATSSSAISRHPPTRRLFTSFISLLTTHSDHRPSFIALHCIAPTAILHSLHSLLSTCACNRHRTATQRTMGNLPNLRTELRKRVWNRAGYIRGRERTTPFFASRKHPFPGLHRSRGDMRDGDPLPLSNISGSTTCGNILKGMGSRPPSMASSISSSATTTTPSSDYSDTGSTNSANFANSSSESTHDKGGKQVKACGCRRYCNKYGVMAECICRVAASYFRRCW